MNKTGKIILAVVVVLVIAGGIWAVTAITNKPAETNNTNTSSEDTRDGASSEQPSTNGVTETVITFNGNAFEPANVTVKVGSTIKVVNNSLDIVEFASDPHPTHTINPELNTGDIEPDSSKTITVTKTGTWGYHNHYNPSQRGTVIVD